ncbi:MAG: LamB/YcsF family protein [Vampirovibrionales bacterium]|nr:LamB/YcsF family protein [Vampirovibrionales bacterium]
MPKTSDLARKSIYPTQLKRYVDLNTDFGQSRDKAYFEQSDYQLLNYVSSVNIPCCVHDGDPKEVIEAIAKARTYHCAIGAHIGYPDPNTSGYQVMEISKEELAAWIHVQLGTFTALAKVNMTTVEHVRPHGALYAAFLNNKETALCIAETIYKIDPWLILMAPAGSILEEVATKTGIRTAPEIYLGKRYNANGQMDEQSMKETGVSLPPQGIFEQGRQLIQQGSLTTAQGKTVEMKYRSMHISPLIQQPQQLAERLCNVMGQPVASNLTDIGASGWLS